MKSLNHKYSFRFRNKQNWNKHYIQSWGRVGQIAEWSKSSLKLLSGSGVLRLQSRWISGIYNFWIFLFSIFQDSKNQVRLMRKEELTSGQKRGCVKRSWWAGWHNGGLNCRWRTWAALVRKRWRQKIECLVIGSRIREWDKKNAEYYVGDYCSCYLTLG